MSKERKLSHGLRLTESEDMGIFMHYESKSGNHSGMFMGNTDDMPGHRWAREILEDVPEKPE
ncbi:MAG: hypothetical protein V3R67_08875 [Thermodesulfobacteriota bacterium]